MARTDAREVHEQRRRAALDVLDRKARVNKGRLPRGIVAALQREVPGLEKRAAINAKKSWTAAGGLGRAAEPAGPGGGTGGRTFRMGPARAAQSGATSTPPQEEKPAGGTEREEVFLA